jgi:hypothetical protein
MHARLARHLPPRHRLRVPRPHSLHSSAAHEAARRWARLQPDAQADLAAGRHASPQPRCHGASSLRAAGAHACTAGGVHADEHGDATAAGSCAWPQAGAAAACGAAHCRRLGLPPRVVLPGAACARTEPATSCCTRPSRARFSPCPHSSACMPPHGCFCQLAEIAGAGESGVACMHGSSLHGWWSAPCCEDSEASRGACGQSAG